MRSRFLDLGQEPVGGPLYLRKKKTLVGVAKGRSSELQSGSTE